MINGVLTERTVKKVIPTLRTNSDGLKKAREELVKHYKSMQDEMEKWKVSRSLIGASRDLVTDYPSRRRTMCRLFSSRVSKRCKQHLLRGLVQVQMRLLHT